MSGKISFHFDDGFMSHYEHAFKIFKAAHAVGCIALPAMRRSDRISTRQALEMQENGWEIISHAKNHIKMHTPLPEDVMAEEIVESKRMLEALLEYCKQKGVAIVTSSDAFITILD